MGMFPYKCEFCGGGYKRCGGGGSWEFDDSDPDYHGHDSDCEGGQFCWEEKCYIYYKNNWVEGIYEGYGSVKVKYKGKIYSEEFKEYFKGWGDVKKSGLKIHCASCHHN